MRWGILGASSRIYERSLGPAMVAAGHTVTAEARRDGESMAAYAEMLTRDDVDAVYNPLPNHLHAEWTHRALEAGKHVLCEKPLTMTVEESTSLFDHAESAGLTLLEAYMWPHHPRAQRLLAMVASREVGSPQWGSARFSWPMDMASGDHRLDLRGAGALFDVGIYCIAPFMLMARRDPIAVASNAVRNTLGVDVTMTGWLDWGGGFGSGFHTSFDAPHTRRLTMSCSDALVDLPGWHAPGPLEDNELVIERRDGSVERVACAGGDAYLGLVQHFAGVVAGDTAPVFGRTESLRLAEILARLHAASVH
ncbi:MAG TPA: Gfo/Idh/MocA family oxidoreductase [Ilumatobacteraceae bacterium]|nr:Gfo/Idh/MocA family oxidoreductase [Ilumatobacteraceae bacterium]